MRKQKLSNLKAIALNVNSLISHGKRVSLNQFLAKDRPNFIFLSETNLKPRHKVSLENYTMLRSDACEEKRGTAILVKKNLHFEPATIHFSKFENTSIKINLDSGETLLLVSVYIPCTTPANSVRNDLNVLNAFSQQFTYTIVGGDFNARHILWNDPETNTVGRAMAKWLEENLHNHNFVPISQDTPTFPRSNSFLDFFLASDNLVNVLPQIRNFTCQAHIGLSDHLAVELKIALQKEFSFSTLVALTISSLDNVDWAQFQDRLNQLIANFLPDQHRNLCNSEIDFFVELLTTSIQDNIESFSTTHHPNNYKYKNLPPRIQELYRHRQKLKKTLNRIYRRRLNTQNPEYSSLLSQIRCLSIIIDEQTRNFVDEQFRDRLKAIKPGPRAFSEINKVCSRKAQVPEKLLDGNNCLNSPEEKSSAFANYFVSTFKSSPPLHLPDFHRQVLTEVKNFEEQNTSPISEFSLENLAGNPNDRLIFTSPLHLTALIRSLNNKKSSGPDKIPNFIIRKLPPLAIEMLTIIFNNCINNCYFPKSWKVSKIIPIPKKASSKSISEFRPISLIPNLGKLLERLVKQHIDDTCIEKEMEQNQQFGFKAMHATLHPLLKFHTDVTQALNKKTHTVACFLDVEKAFDSIWREGLIYKLMNFQFPPYLIRMLNSFLSDRQFFVEIKNCSSELKEIKAGVPQGSVLGPFLFNLFTFDQPQNTGGVTTLLYADDSLTYAHSKSPKLATKKVGDHIAKLYEYYRKWGIKINIPKSNLLCIRTARSRRGVPRSARNIKVTINNEVIKPTSSAKYLGINFNERFKFNPHAKAVARKANFALSMVSPIMRYRNGLSLKTKLLMYKQLIRPTITYSFPIWHTISPTYMESLARFERKTLRICTGLYRRPCGKHYRNQVLYEKAGISPIQEYLVELMKKQVAKIPNHPNPIVHELTNYPHLPTNRYLSALCLQNQNCKRRYYREEIFTFFREKGDNHRG